MKAINKNKNAINKNYIYNKVIDEMNGILDKIINYNISYMDCYGLDLYYLDDDKLVELENKYDYIYELSSAMGKYDRELSPLYKTVLYDYVDNAYECEFNIIKLNINSNKCKKEVIFNSNGDIRYSNNTKGKRDNKINYSIKYNIDNNDITIIFKNNDNVLEIDINKNIINIKDNDLSIMIDTGIYTKSINYIYNIDNKKVIFEITLDAYNDVISKNIIVRNIDLECSYYLEYKGNIVYNAYVEDKFERRNILDNDLIMNYITLLICSCMNENPRLCYDDNNLNILIDLIRDKLFNNIKGIKNDILLDGLNRRLEMVLALIKSQIYKEKDDKIKKLLK